jgi:hypothetical protein
MTEKMKADDFDAAFAEAAKGEDQQVTDDTAADDDAATGDDDAAAAAAAEEGDNAATGDDDEAAKGGEDTDDDAGGDPPAGASGDGDAGAGGEEGEAGKGDPPAKAGDGEAPLSNDDLLARMSELLGKGSAEQHQQQQPPTKAQSDDKGGADAKGEEQQQQQPLYTEEEQQLIDTYQKDWPDIARAEALSRRAEYQQLLNFVFTQVQAVVGPLTETVDVMSNQSHLAQLQGQIPDYDDVRDKVVKWVDDQPAYLQAAYKHVITEGTAEEVADLVERYRKENGIEPPAKQEKASSGKQQQQSQDTELPAATKKAAAGLAPVRSKRSNAGGEGADPADFDAAFAEFAKKI